MKTLFSFLLFELIAAKKCTLPSARFIKAGSKIFCAIYLAKYREQPEAVQACKNLKAKLFLPKNDKENKAFLSAFPTLKYYYWLDITDPFPCLGKWEDSDGRNVTYFNWHKSQKHQNYVNQYAYARGFNVGHVLEGEWTRVIPSERASAICVQQVTGEAIA